MIASHTTSKTKVKDLLKRGSRFIAPLWSLENFVAVNSYMGFSDMHFSSAMDFINKTSKAEGTLPLSFYLKAIEVGRITVDDIAKELRINDHFSNADVDEFLFSLKQPIEKTEPIQTISDIVSLVNGKQKQWDRFMVDRVSFWASAYFDEKQASWDTAKQKGNVFKDWKREAETDFGAEVMGLKGFRKLIASLPENYLDAASLSLDVLEVPDEMIEQYLNRLLMRLNGWAGFTARIDWDARLAGKESDAIQQFLAILIVWEMALKSLLNYPNIDEFWIQSKDKTLRNIGASTTDIELESRLVLQNAFDRANQRNITAKINNQQKQSNESCIAKFQSVFCIDVRSEVFRRNLESVNSEMETLGFAGFFAFPIEYVPVGYEEGTNQCPVLLNTSHTVKERLESPHQQKKLEKRRKRLTHVQKALKAFKQGAISCFGFVSPLGIFFLPKLISDSIGYTIPIRKRTKIGLSKDNEANRTIGLAGSMEGSDGIPLEDRVKMGASALRAMSLTENFGKVIVITGHGSSSINNPHASGLDCGACGGNTGEVNAKVATTVLNDQEVREALVNQGINIPNETLFVAAIHDTTTDEVTMFRSNSTYSSPESDKHIEELEYTFKLAGEKSRQERAARMGITSGDIQSQVIKRSRDWSQVRPEWGLAGCSSFIVAPRERTSQLNLEGKSFMHNYSWKKDTDFSVLELIMTAPMVVTSWINLQYYASTVDNKVFGAGNKTLHNVVGGVGVLEGFGGDLRVGLPMQSVNDGEKFQHEPLRLNVMIEAPVDEMSKILDRHDSIRALCDNDWIFLFAINDQGKVAYKYVGNLEWELIY